MDAKFTHQSAGLHHHVDQVGYGRALVAADVGDARLKQRLGHGKDAFPVEDIALPEGKRLDFPVEGSFQANLPIRTLVDCDNDHGVKQVAIP